MSKPEIHIEAHPPERGRRRGEVVLCGCCCCCCCCCLHTIGSVVGAAIAPAFGSKRPSSIQAKYRLLVEEYDFNDDESAIPSPEILARKRGLSAIAVYWVVVLLLSVLAAGGTVYLGMSSSRSSDNFFIALVLLVLGFPVLQLVASLLTALVMVASTQSDKWRQLLQVGKITLGTLIGTVLGIVSMVGIAFLFGAFR